MTVPTEFRPDLQPFASLQIFVRDDDDKFFDGVPDHAAATDGHRVYVRASMWPALRAELEQLPKVQ